MNIYFFFCLAFFWMVLISAACEEHLLRSDIHLIAFWMPLCQRTKTVVALRGHGGGDQQAQSW